MLLGAGDRPEFAFSHALHVGEEGLDCVSCHEGVGVGDEPGMPELDLCLACHEVIDAESPPERQVASLFDGGVYRAQHAARLEDEVVFSHLHHVDAVEDCAACHGGIEANAWIAPDDALDMDDCTTCHEARGRADECSICHTLVGPDWAPASHAANWKRRHGGVCRRGGAEPADRCSLCHQESSCAACHRTQAPQSHNEFFRMRGHGVLARLDRQTCAACHEPSSCERCHRDTLPLSHRGSFGGTRSRHCLTCHFPLQGEGCAACHSSTPSHDLAPPKPGWHDPAMNCRACHGSSLPLSHADNGTNCNLCHQ
jgi:hypothetical protein